MRNLFLCMTLFSIYCFRVTCPLLDFDTGIFKKGHSPYLFTLLSLLLGVWKILLYLYYKREIKSTKYFIQGLILWLKKKLWVSLQKLPSSTVVWQPLKNGIREHVTYFNWVFLYVLSCIFLVLVKSILLFLEIFPTRIWKDIEDLLLH